MQNLIFYFSEKEKAFFVKLSSFHPLVRNVILFTILFFLALPAYLAANAMIDIYDAHTLNSGFEEKIPFLPWTVVIYDWVYVIIFFPIFIIRDIGLLRATAKAFLFGICISLVCFTFFPMRIERPEIGSPENFIEWWLWINYTIDRPTTLFPSMHVSNAILTSLVIIPWSKRVGYSVLTLAIVISFSTLTIRQHYIADVIAGLLLALSSYYFFLKPYIDSSHSIPKEEIILPEIYSLIVPILGLTGCFILYCIYLFF